MQDLADRQFSYLIVRDNCYDDPNRTQTENCNKEILGRSMSRLGFPWHDAGFLSADRQFSYLIGASNKLTSASFKGVE